MEAASLELERASGCGAVGAEYPEASQELKLRELGVGDLLGQAAPSNHVPKALCDRLWDGTTAASQLDKSTPWNRQQLGAAQVLKG